MIAHLIAFIQPRDVPEHMFQHLFAEHGEIRSTKAFNYLVRYSLIQKYTSHKESSAGQNMYSMHVLVQAAIKRSLFTQGASAGADQSSIPEIVEEIAMSLTSESALTFPMGHRIVLLLCKILTDSPIFQSNQMVDIVVQREVYPHACHFLANHAVNAL